MPDEAVYNDLGEVTKLGGETAGLLGIALDRLIVNDVYCLQGWYNPAEEACSGTVRILMADGVACDITKKCKRASY